MNFIMNFIFYFVVIIILVALFPGLRAWINGGSTGVKEYKKQKKEKY